MFKKIIGAAMVTMVAVQSFAYEVECRNADEAARAKSHGFTCAPTKEETSKRLNAITLLRMQKQCAIELKALGCQEMTPLDDSGCVISKEKIASGRYAGMEQTNYVAYFNQRVKLVTTIHAGSCKIDQTYFAGRLSNLEVFDNKLFALVNGKPMFFDDNSKLQELLSGSGKSYVLDGAKIKSIEASVDGSTLKMERQYPNSDKTQPIKIDSAELKDSNRQKPVEASLLVHAIVPELGGIEADIVR